MAMLNSGFMTINLTLFYQFSDKRALRLCPGDFENKVFYIPHVFFN